MREIVGVLNKAERSAPVRIVKMLEFIPLPACIITDTSDGTV